MKKNIFYLFAHQDDEFVVFIDIKKNLLKHNVFIFYLTSGANKKINKKNLSIRDNESLKVLKKIGVKTKNIYFLGKNLGIKTNTLYLKLNVVYKNLFRKIKKIGKPIKIITHSWEGGHEDHDACNLIARKLANRFRVFDDSLQFSLYNAYETKLIYFKVFNPITKAINKSYTVLKNRIFFVKLLFIYKSQIKIWVGLYPFIIFHYLFKGYNIFEKLNKSKKIIKPHNGKLLYELRNFCTFKKFKNTTSQFLNDRK